MAEAIHEEVHRHEAPTGFIRRYIFSLDHKVIGIQYILLALTAVVVGLVMSVLMRMNLSWPGTNWPIMGTLFPTGEIKPNADPSGRTFATPDCSTLGRIPMAPSSTA